MEIILRKCFFYSLSPFPGFFFITSSLCTGGRIMAAPLRSEIDNEFKWAVNDIYSSDNAWEEDYQKLIKQAGEPCEYQFVLTESADNLYNVLKELNDTDYLVERLYVYAFMRYY